MNDIYILDDDHQPRKAGWDEYGAWLRRGFEETKRVAKDTVGENEVSTVFLGLDHSWGDGPPVLFETMTFGPIGEYQWRYTTWDAAVAGHNVVVQALRDGASLDLIR